MGERGLTAWLLRDGWSPGCRVWQNPSQPLPPHASFFPASRPWDCALRPSTEIQGHLELLSDSSGGRGFPACSRRHRASAGLGRGRGGWWDKASEVLFQG